MSGVIRLRAVTDNDLISHTIRGGELGFWASHVVAVTPDDHYLGAHYSGGVQKRPNDYDKGVWTEQLFIDLPTSSYQAKAFYDWCESKIGTPYDMDAIRSMATGFFSGMADVSPQEMPHCICSAFIAGGLIVAEVWKSAPAMLRLTTPRDVVVMCGTLVPLGPPHAP